MGKTVGKLSVFFEETFWVGVFEIIEDAKQRDIKKQMADTGIGTNSPVTASRKLFATFSPSRRESHCQMRYILPQL